MGRGICMDNKVFLKIRKAPPSWSRLASKIKGRKVVGLEPRAGSWSMFFFKRNKRGQITGRSGKRFLLNIRDPFTIDFKGKQLQIVLEINKNLTQRRREIAEYWGFRPPTKQWTPIIDRLIDTYDLSPPRSARVLGVVHAGINDALIITWLLKYRWDVARPNQLDQSLKTVIPTPKFPAYPSGHAAVSGVAQVILSYFFPAEAKRLKELAEENAISRLYAGVHFPIDNTEGIRLGRQIGHHIVSILRKQRDSKGNRVDTPYVVSRNAVLPPPPYKQVIPFPPK